MKTKLLIASGGLLLAALWGYVGYKQTASASEPVEIVEPVQMPVQQEDDDDDEDGEPDGPFDQWYRDIRFERWTEAGADPGVILATLTKIEQAEGKRDDPTQPDTIIEYGPGQWTYEWNQIAEYALLSAEMAADVGYTELAHEQFMQAAIYYNMAGYPNLNRDYENEAMDNALTAYERAGEYADWTLEKITLPVAGKSIPVLLHLPLQEDEQPLPVVMVTGGTDVTLVEHYGYFADYFKDAGVAMVTFDVPGTGGSGELKLDKNSEKVHLAVMNFLANDARFDENRVAAFSSSMGGNAVVKIAVLEQDRIRAVVNRCGTVHSPLVAPPEAIAHIPEMTLDVFATRTGAELKNLEEIASLAKPISLVEQGVLTDEIVTTVPILNINTHDDPIFPPEDMLLVAHNSLDGSVVFDGVAGHCPEDSEAYIADWLIRHLEK